MPMKNETYELRALIGRAQPALKDGFTLKISDATIEENLQVEIRDASGGLCWRMWSFEPDFDFYLKNEIERATDCRKSVENKTEGNEIMCKKQEWQTLAEKCDVACNKYWAARDSVECAETYWEEYQLARKAERDSYAAYLAN